MGLHDEPVLTFLKTEVTTAISDIRAKIKISEINALSRSPSCEGQLHYQQLCQSTANGFMAYGSLLQIFAPEVYVCCSANWRKVWAAAGHSLTVERLGADEPLASGSILQEGR